MTRILSLAFALAALSCLAGPPLCAAQSGQDGAAHAPILRTERAGAGVVRIVYELGGAAGTLFTVALDASTDGGQTFAVHPRAVTGDVGSAVSAGSAKTIVWDTTKDVEDLQIDRYVFRVRVAPAGASVAPVAPSTSSPPVRGGPSGAPGAVSGGGSAATSPKRGGLSKGAIIAIAGGGAAAGVGVAVKGSGSGSGSSSGSSGSSSSTPPPLSGSHSYAGPFSGQVVITFPGNQPCTRTESGLGTLRLTLLITNGTVSGTASADTTGSVTAVTCSSGPQLNDPRGFGSFSAAVSGTTSALGFSVRITHPHEDGTVALLDWKFTGSLSGDTLSGTLTMDTSQASPPGLQFTQFASPVTARESK